jgi:2-succinyl-5-enolpyruvyl-6-hydroxy-3-cyclohexene-1-carboxylate synthase
MTHLVDQLISLGCDFFCIAPGSRSTPLIVAVANHPKAKSIVAHDERSLGFFALGYAKAIQKPVAIIVTSGTAVANLLPAIIEASLDHVPLIILSADRPTELRALGANQTIDQVKIFGSYVRYFFDLAPEMPTEFILSQVREAAFKSMHPLPGPVQINCQFREPFQLESLSCCSVHGKIPPNLPFPKGGDLTHFHHQLKQSKNGLVVVGAMKTRAQQQATLKIIEHLGWRAICDVTSGLRFLKHPQLDHAREFTNLEADCVLQLGGRIVLKPFLQWLESRRGQEHIYVDDYFENHDPGLTVTHRVQADLTWLSENLQ